MILTSLLRNKIFVYVSTRYLTYFVEFLTTLVLAAKLGPYYMGIWGSVVLLLNYFQQCNFGISHSLNVFLVHHIDEKEKASAYITNSIVLILYLSIGVVFFFLLLHFLPFSLFEKYDIDKYILFICIIAVLQYYRMMLINVFRVYNHIGYVIYAQSIIILSCFIVTFLFSKESLIQALIISYLFGNVSTLLLSVMPGSPSVFDCHVIDKKLQKQIFQKGFWLFLYNSSFYFILLFDRTVVSIGYSVDEFGIYTFANTLAMAMMLLINAISFVGYPKLIKMLHNQNTREIRSQIVSINRVYVTSTHILVYTAMLLFPLLIQLLPEFGKAGKAFNILSIGTLINAYSFVTTTLLVANNREKKAALAAIWAFVINVFLAVLISKVMTMDFVYVSLAAVCSYSVYVVLTIKYSFPLTGFESHNEIWKIVMSPKQAVPFIVFAFVAILSVRSLYIMPLFLFVILNWKDVLMVKKVGLNLAKHPESTNIV